MSDPTIHSAYRPKGAVPAGPGEALPSPLPEPVLTALSGLDLPGFLYRLPVLRESVREMAAAFPGFFFPAKCNPHPRVLGAVIAAGAGLSLRSFGELDLALRLGACPERLSFTGWGLGPVLMDKLTRLGVTVNLDSAREVRSWVEVFPTRPFGVRLMAGDDPEYLSAGFAQDEVRPMMEEVRRARARLTGVLVHWPHPVASADEMAKEFSSLPRLLRNSLGPALADLQYLNLGGGWPAPYGGGNPIPPAEAAGALFSRLLPALRAAGFAGRLTVEPGRAVAAACGHWATRVIKAESRDGIADITLDTPPPAPPFRLPYPAHLLRDGVEMRGGRSASCRLLGLASPPLDVIRERILLPPPRAGDLLVFAQAGAYLSTGLLPEGRRRRAGESTIEE